MPLVVLLFVLFLVLKLTGVVAWSWLWVTAPLWVAAVLAAIGVAIVGVIAWIAGKVSNLWDL